MSVGRCQTPAVAVRAGSSAKTLHFAPRPLGEPSGRTGPRGHVPGQTRDVYQRGGR